MVVLLCFLLSAGAPPIYRINTQLQLSLLGAGRNGMGLDHGRYSHPIRGIVNGRAVLVYANGRWALLCISSTRT